MSTRRSRILQALKARVEAIRVSAGFETDAGASVFLGERPPLGPNDPPVNLLIVPGDEEAIGQMVQKRRRMPVQFHVVVLDESLQPLGLWLLVEAVIGDIQKAVELPDRTLGGLANDLEGGAILTVPRETGLLVAGTAVEYIVTYPALWGDPTA